MESYGLMTSSLHRHSYRRIVVGCVNGRRFLFHTGLGFDAAVVAQVERRNELKRYAGHPLFVASAFVTWFRHYDHSRPHFAIKLGDDLIDGCYFAIVSKTSPYTYLGSRPVVVAPEADLDSRLSVTAFRTLSFAPVMAAVGSALGTGKLLRRHPRLVHRGA